MIKRLFIAALTVLSLTQCNSLRSDCRAIAEREADIARETPGDYYVGRRYYLPNTRFWGYVRPAGKSWREAKLVMMDESVTHTPDRGWEYPHPKATYSFDNNYEYYITGSYLDEKAYDPNSNQILPLFRPTSFKLRSKEPGFLFKPSEQYLPGYVTLMPGIMPTAEQVKQYSR